MNKIINLTKVFLKTSFSNMNTQMGMPSKSNKIVSKILYAVLFLYLAAIVALFSGGMVESLKIINQQEIFIGLILLVVTAFCVIQTIFSSINVFYFTKDNEYILPLPLKPYEIILARTNVLIITEYIVTVLIGFIPLLVYGVLTSASMSYYLLMFVALVLVPILPILLVSIIVMIIMSFAKITKNKNKFQLIATILVLSIVIALSLSTTKLQDDITNEQLAHMLVEANGMVDLLKGYFPTLDYAISSLTSDSIVVALIELLKVLVFTISGVIVYVFIAQKIYFKGLVGNLFSSSSKKKNIKINTNKYNNSKLYKSYISKEFKCLIRNPVFFMQCLLPAILIPLLMIVMVILQMKNSITPQMSEQLNSFNGNTFIVACVILSIIQFFSMFIYIAITAISRDGKNAIFMKYIPVSLYKQYIYKCIPNIVMGSITSIISIVVANIILKLDMLMIVLVFIVAIIMNVAESIILIIIDLKRPKLEWDSEYAVVKQNFNLIFPMIISMVAIFIIILAGVFLTNINVYIGIIILSLIFAIILYFANMYLYKNQNRLASRIM